jgi:5-hydroxyisourate hydrolase
MISTHVLDTNKGSPADGITVRLRRRENQTWKEVGRGVTNKDGRLVFDCEKKSGVYQLIFEVEPYLQNESKDFFFPRVPVVFKIEDTNRKYHVPLLLSPFGYSTYRGS